jgi:hypothetical protein
MAGTIDIPLKRPITAHGKEITVLTLTEPGTEDLIAVGSPILVIPSATGDAGMEVRPKVVAAYITRLAKIPPSSVKELHPADFNKCQEWLLPLLQGEET